MTIKHIVALIMLAIALAYTLIPTGILVLATSTVLAILSVAYVAGLTFPPRGKNPSDAKTKDERERAVTPVHAKSKKTRPAPDGDGLLALPTKHVATQSNRQKAELPVKPEKGREYLHDGPTLVFTRKRRALGFDVTRDGTSWFGGLPALGEHPWPRNEHGLLLTPIAQVDLSEVSANVQIAGLPTSGSLAFFVDFNEYGISEGAVRFIEKPGEGSTNPPETLRPVMNIGRGGSLRHGEPEDAQVVFPRMAIEMKPVTSYNGDGPNEFREQVSQAFGPAPEGSLRPEDFFDSLPDETQPFNRDCVLRFAHGIGLALRPKARVSARAKIERQLDKSKELLTGRLHSLQKQEALLAKASEAARPRLVAGLEESRKKIASNRASVERYSKLLLEFETGYTTLLESYSDLNAWASTGDRWPPLTEEEQAEVAPLLTPWTTFESFGWFHINSGSWLWIPQCVEETLRVMAVSEDAIFAFLPDEIREAANSQLCQPPEGTYHQMFGKPAHITSAKLNCEAYLLLQLSTDDLLGFHWGETGVVEFWIRPEDLQVGHWEKAIVTSVVI